MNKLVNRYGATILTVFGGAGVIVTSIMAIKATPKALSLLEEAEKEKGDELTKWETVKVAAPVYIPTVLMGVGTMVCIFGANGLSKHQQASLASAYALVDQSYKEYRDKLKELYGEKVHEKIMDSIAAEKAEKRYISAPGLSGSNRLYLLDEDVCGKVLLFYDVYSKRYFEATLEQVIEAEYHLNRNFVLRGYALLNEFYEFLGIDTTDYGEEVGWVVLDEDIYWIDFNHRKKVDDNYEYYIIEIAYEPSIEWKTYY